MVSSGLHGYYEFTAGFTLAGAYSLGEVDGEGDGGQESPACPVGLSVVRLGSRL